MHAAVQGGRIFRSNFCLMATDCWAEELLQSFGIPPSPFSPTLEAPSALAPKSLAPPGWPDGRTFKSPEPFIFLFKGFDNDCQEAFIGL